MIHVFPNCGLWMDNFIFSCGISKRSGPEAAKQGGILPPPCFTDRGITFSCWMVEFESKVSPLIESLWKRWPFWSASLWEGNSAVESSSFVHDQLTVFHPAELRSFKQAANNRILPILFLCRAFVSESNLCKNQLHRSTNRPVISCFLDLTHD